MVERLRRAVLRRAIRRRSSFVSYAGQVSCIGRALWRMREWSLCKSVKRRKVIGSWMFHVSFYTVSIRQ
jgi:hypothetical protein